MIGLRRLAMSGVLVLSVVVVLGGCSPTADSVVAPGASRDVAAQSDTVPEQIVSIDAARRDDEAAKQRAADQAARDKAAHKKAAEKKAAEKKAAHKKAAEKKAAHKKAAAAKAAQKKAAAEAAQQKAAAKAAPKKTTHKKAAPKKAAPKKTVHKKKAPKKKKKKKTTAPKPTIRAHTVPALVSLTNQQRAAHGKKALSISSCAQHYALLRAQAEAQANRMVHTPTSGLKSALTRCNASWVGENIAMRFSSNSAVMNAWMNSPGHRANILSGHANAIGIAMATASNGTTYYAQFFLGVR